METQSPAEMIRKQVVLEIEGIDRMCQYGYTPTLQTEGGFVHFAREQLGLPIASTAAVAGMMAGFVKSIEQFAEREGVDVVTFTKGQRKDDVAKAYLELVIREADQRSDPPWMRIGEADRSVPS